MAPKRGSGLLERAKVGYRSVPTKHARDHTCPGECPLTTGLRPVGFWFVGCVRPHRPAFGESVKHGVPECLGLQDFVLARWLAWPAEGPWCLSVRMQKSVCGFSVCVCVLHIYIYMYMYIYIFLSRGKTATPGHTAPRTANEAEAHALKGCHCFE